MLRQRRISKRIKLISYSAADEVMMPGRENYRATIKSDGSVSYNFPTVLKSICRIDVTYFPFDTQVCRMTFGSWSHHGFELDLFTIGGATKGTMKKSKRKSTIESRIKT